MRTVTQCDYNNCIKTLLTDDPIDVCAPLYLIAHRQYFFVVVIVFLETQSMISCFFSAAHAIVQCLIFFFFAINPEKREEKSISCTRESLHSPIEQTRCMNIFSKFFFRSIRGC
jgi:hypothetical protein